MLFSTLSSRLRRSSWAPVRSTAAICGLFFLAMSLEISAQEPAPPAAPAAATQQPAAPDPAPDAAQQPAATPAAENPPAAQQPASTQEPAAAAQPAAQEPAAPHAAQQPGPDKAAVPEPSQAGGITEEEVKHQLVGKAFYLRGGYLDNAMSFDERGKLVSHSAQGSYTLSAIEIDKVHLTKHKVELEGARFGLHFLGALPYEDPTTALDRVRITPKKKVVKITIDREIVVTPKKIKQKGKGKPVKGAPAEPPELSAEDQLKASVAAAPQAERPADEKSVTTTISPAHAAGMLRSALDQIFAEGLDERMMASMPDFWKLYYQAVAAKTDYRPKDPSVLRQNTVDTKARLLTTFEPASNEFAQASGVAGMALYHTVIGADGKPGEIAVGRPIGFGLDENAVEAIRKAKFEPAVKDGKPVAVMLDLVVQFRIYSKRTAVMGRPEAADKVAETILPGPYSVMQR